MSVKRIGIFGGTFDPPHLGHLILAEGIRETFDLEEIHFMPCHEPPHKDRADLTDARHRFAMVVAATLHNLAFVASAVEVNRPGKSFSIDTVRALREDMGEGDETIFVTGLDAFVEIETWKEYEQFLDLCHVVVVSRPGHGFEEIQQLPDWIHDRVVDLRDNPGNPADHFSGKDCKIFLADTVHIDISSTDIRERFHRGKSIRYKVPAEVERYIRANGLYRPSGAAQEVAP